MVNINPKNQDKKSMYQLLTTLIVPRPIAFIVTKGSNKVINAAPFSYFNIVTAYPARLSVVINHGREGLKDTARNILEAKELVIHGVSHNILKDVNTTSAGLPKDQSELDLTHLTQIPSQVISTPSIKESPYAIECRLYKRIEFEEADMFIVDIVHVSLREDLNIFKRDMIGRLEGNKYTKIGQIIELDRPK